MLATNIARGWFLLPSPMTTATIIRKNRPKNGDHKVSLAASLANGLGDVPDAGLARLPESIRLSRGVSSTRAIGHLLLPVDNRYVQFPANNITVSFNRQLPSVFQAQFLLLFWRPLLFERIGSFWVLPRAVPTSASVTS
jgi:hypothetical protein